MGCGASTETHGPDEERRPTARPAVKNTIADAETARTERVIRYESMALRASYQVREWSAPSGLLGTRVECAERVTRYARVSVERVIKYECAALRVTRYEFERLGRVTSIGHI